MAGNNYVRLKCKVLEILKQCAENGETVTSRKLNYDILEITDYQFFSILKSLSDQNYISDFIYQETIGDDVPAYNVYGIKITPEGLEYLDNNQ